MWKEGTDTPTSTTGKRLIDLRTIHTVPLLDPHRCSADVSENQGCLTSPEDSPFPDPNDDIIEDLVEPYNPLQCALEATYDEELILELTPEEPWKPVLETPNPYGDSDRGDSSRNMQFSPPQEEILFIPEEGDLPFTLSILP